MIERGPILAVLIQILPLMAFAQERVLPPLKPETKDQVSRTLQLFVREFRFQGNTVFSSNVLARVVESYARREITDAELEEARRALTLHYSNAGYINSGAILEDQRTTGGVITFTIGEGRLSEIEISGNTWLRSSFLRERIETHVGPPLNMKHLSEGLLLLKENPNLRRINAELKPGAVAGTSWLDVKVEEKSPWRLGLQARNDRPPSVGAEVIELLAAHTDLTGHSDALALRYGIAQRTSDDAEFSGLDNLGVHYSLPLTSRDTTLQAYYERNDYAIIEDQFQDLDIDSESSTYGLALRQPLWKTLNREIALGVVFERRETKSFLFGDPFSFSAGAVKGESVVSALRFYQEWLERNQEQVVAVRSTFSFGVDVLAATDGPTIRDGSYATWQGQAQYIRRLGRTQNQLLLSSTVQWADNPLLSAEQFSIGGANTVRGYRENEIVRDMGLLSSVELRVPIWFGPTGNPRLQLAPFFDYGQGWNVNADTPPVSELMSSGLGLLFTPHQKVSAQIYWGHRFRRVGNPHDDLQDYGIHFNVRVELF